VASSSCAAASPLTPPPTTATLILLCSLSLCALALLSMFSASSALSPCPFYLTWRGRGLRHNSHSVSVSTCITSHYINKQMPTY
jgi:hypothetical protein